MVMQLAWNKHKSESIDMKKKIKHYAIFDENGEVMRWVKTKHEAEQIIKTYKDWSYTLVVPKKEVKFKFEDAPF